MGLKRRPQRLSSVVLGLVGRLGHGIHHQCGAEQIEYVTFVSRKGLRFAFAATAHLTIA
jgi:hypothetical protein